MLRSSSHFSSCTISHAATILARNGRRKGTCRRRHLPTTSFNVLGAASAFFSSSASSSSAKVQLSGRPRFYRHVSIVPTRAPWIVDTSNDNQELKGSSSSQVVASPISAGVDGTDSATGVVVTTTNNRRRNVQQHYFQTKDGESRTVTIDEDCRRWLQPRRPDGRHYDASADQNSLTVTSSSSSSWHAVCLDDKVLQTPARSTLAVPSPALASAIASEWNAQSPILKPAQMPLTTLTCTVLDQVRHQPVHYQESVLRYVATDTLRYWADPTNDPTLFEEQNRLWTPVLDRLHTILGREYPTQKADSNVIIYSNRHSSRMKNGSLNGANSSLRDGELMDTCRQWVESLDAWHLGILYALTVEAKSFGMAMAYLHDSIPQPMTTTSASREGHYVASCRVEEEVQIAQWGLVEGGHDYDRLNCSIQVRAASFLHQCLQHELLFRGGPQ